MTGKGDVRGVEREVELELDREDKVADGRVEDRMCSLNCSEKREETGRKERVGKSEFEADTRVTALLDFGIGGTLGERSVAVGFGVGKPAADGDKWAGRDREDCLDELFSTGGTGTRFGVRGMV